MAIKIKDFFQKINNKCQNEENEEKIKEFCFKRTKLEF